MYRTANIHLFLLTALSLFLLGCERQPDSPGPLQTETLPLSVMTVNYPLAYFAARIGGEMVTASYPGPANTDPAYWKPDTDTIISYQQADLILLNGAGYAGWTKQVSLPLAKQIDTSTAFTELLLPLSDKLAHTHGPTGEHVHDDLAFTVWLDPELAKLQSTAIRDALLKLLPEQESIIDANLITLVDELWTLDEELARTLKSRNRQQIIYSHPVYQYLDRRYELNGLSMHWEPDALPPDSEFAKLHNFSGALMLWESEPLPETVARLEAMGIRSVIFDPCATRPESGDYLSVMQSNLQRLKSAVL